MTITASTVARLRKKLSPMTMRGEQVLKLRTDNTEAGDFWMIADGYTVTICEQKSGESPEAMLTIPRAEFNRLIRWYIKEQDDHAQRHGDAPGGREE